MTINEIKSRINPAYQDVLGTESHERKMLCDEIDRLTRLVSSYKTITTSHEKQICALTDTLDALRGADKTLDSEREANALLTEQLAASQAREQQLREALTIALFGGGDFLPTEYTQLCKVRDQQPQDTSALDQLKAGYEAHIQQLREALEQIAGLTDGEEWRITKEALALPQDTSALEAVVQRAGEVMRQRSMKVAFDIEPTANGPIEAGIRKLQCVTLGDLK